MSRPSHAWLPLGSAHAIDWKHLGRPASTRGATAWIGSLTGETVVIRAWGEETTSFFDFVMLTDERVAGTVTVSCTRTDGNRLRLKTELEVDGYLAFTDVCDFRESSRTLLLTAASRTFEASKGSVSERDVPAITAQPAELFEIAPDSAMQTACADWLASLIDVAKTAVRSREAPPERAPAEEKNGKTRDPEPPPAKKGDATPRARTEHAGGVRPNAPRETLDGNQPPRRVPAPETSRERIVPPVVEPPARERSPAKGAAKLVCSTNSGESFEIVDAETFIGRSKQCAIVLKSQRVSRKHACVTKEGDGFYINDLGAANGIWAGSEKIDREKIETGDEFIIGDVVLTFSLTN
jgi:hypothetical protein